PATSAGPAAAGSGPAAAGPRPAPRRRRRWLVVALVAVIVLAAGAAGALVATRATPSHPVPNLVGISREKAEQRLQALHLRLRVAAPVYDAHAPVGNVVSQIPTAGRLKEGDSVAVSLSRGPQPVAVPDVH